MSQTVNFDLVLPLSSEETVFTTPVKESCELVDKAHADSNDVLTDEVKSVFFVPEKRKRSEGHRDHRKYKLSIVIGCFPDASEQLEFEDAFFEAASKDNERIFSVFDTVEAWTTWSVDACQTGILDGILTDPNSAFSRLFNVFKRMIPRWHSAMVICDQDLVVLIEASPLIDTFIEMIFRYYGHYITLVTSSEPSLRPGQQLSQRSVWAKQMFAVASAREQLVTVDTGSDFDIETLYSELFPRLSEI